MYPTSEIFDAYRGAILLQVTFRMNVALIVTFRSDSRLFTQVNISSSMSTYVW